MVAPGLPGPADHVPEGGEEGTLTAHLQDSAGQPITAIPDGTRVEWESSDPQEVQVMTASGSLVIKVKALKTAETNDPVKEVSITVTVTPAGGAWASWPPAT